MKCSFCNKEAERMNENTFYPVCKKHIERGKITEAKFFEKFPNYKWWYKLINEIRDFEKKMGIIHKI